MKRRCIVLFMATAMLSTATYATAVSFVCGDVKSEPYFVDNQVIIGADWYGEELSYNQKYLHYSDVFRDRLEDIGLNGHFLSGHLLGMSAEQMATLTDYRIIHQYKLDNTIPWFADMSLGGGQSMMTLSLAVDTLDTDRCEIDAAGKGKSPVPEPTTLVLVGAGLACVAGFGRKWQ